MSEVERMFAIKETARKIVLAVQSEGLAFISEKTLRKMDVAASENAGTTLVDLVEHLHEKDEDVIRIVETVLDSMS